MTTQLSNFKQLRTSAIYCDLKRNRHRSFAITDMSAITSTVLFRSENKGANECP